MTSRHLRPGRRLLLTGVALTIAATAPAAGAPVGAAAVANEASTASEDDPVARAAATGTIVFIKDHDVWIARGDGSGARALTTDGTATSPYGSPTQSDNGIVVATKVTQLVRMTQSGRVLNRMDPGPLPTSVGIDIGGNVISAAVSPNGARIAYSFTQYLSPSGASSGYRSATGYTAADRLTDPRPSRSTFFWSPSWVGNARTLQTGGYGSQVMVQDLGSDAVHWFDDEDLYDPSTDLGDTELSPDGRHLAGVRGYDDSTAVYWYAVNGDARTGAPPADPTPLCRIGFADGVTHPTWGPDGDSLAWQENDGIWTIHGVDSCASPTRLLLPGGSEPDWSPAPLNPPVTQPSDSSWRNTVRPAIRGKARVGATLRATTGSWSRAGLTYRFTWLRNGKKIAGRAGSARMHKIVRADRGKALTVRVTASVNGVSRSASSKPVRVRR